MAKKKKKPVLKFLLMTQDLKDSLEKEGYTVLTKFIYPEKLTPKQSKLLFIKKKSPPRFKIVNGEYAKAVPSGKKNKNKDYV